MRSRETYIGVLQRDMDMCMIERHGYANCNDIDMRIIERNRYAYYRDMHIRITERHGYE